MISHVQPPSPPAQKCTGCDAADAGSSGCSCSVSSGLGGFSDINGTFDASLALNPYHYFNWHPLLMTLGFVLCYMEGSLAYRVLPFTGTIAAAPINKWIHGTLQGIATACGIAGTVCIFKYHTATDGYTLYSLHSWVGLITVILFAFQFVMGLWFFALQKNGAIRGYFIATHRWLGTLLGAFTATAIVTGILDMQRTIWDLGMYQGMPATDPKAPSIVLSNWWCVLVAVAAATTFQILYDQTDKVKAVFKNEGKLLEPQPEQGGAFVPAQPLKAPLMTSAGMR